MNEYLASIIIYSLFLFLSLVFRKKMLSVKSPWLVLFFVSLYLAGIDIYFELLNKIDQILRDHRIYVEFGHASILLLEVFAICLLTSIIIIISIIFSRQKNKKLVA